MVRYFSDRSRASFDGSATNKSKQSSEMSYTSSSKPSVSSSSEASSLVGSGYVSSKDDEGSTKEMILKDLNDPSLEDCGTMDDTLASGFPRPRPSQVVQKTKNTPYTVVPETVESKTKVETSNDDRVIASTGRSWKVWKWGSGRKTAKGKQSKKQVSAGKKAAERHVHEVSKPIDENQERQIATEGVTKEFSTLIQTCVNSDESTASAREKKNKIIREFVQAYVAAKSEPTTGAAIITTQKSRADTTAKSKSSKKSKGAASQKSGSKGSGKTATKAESSKKKSRRFRSIFSSKKNRVEEETDDENTLEVDPEKQERSMKLAAALVAHYAAKRARELQWEKEVFKISGKGEEENINKVAAEEGNGLGDIIKELQSDVVGVFLDEETGLKGMVDEMSSEVSKLTSPEARAYLMTLLALLFVEFPTAALAKSQDVISQAAVHGREALLLDGDSTQPTESTDSTQPMTEEDLGLAAFFKDIAEQVSKLSDAETREYAMTVFTVLSADLPQSALETGKSSMQVGKEKASTFYRDITEYDDDIGMSACISTVWKDCIMVKDPPC